MKNQMLAAFKTARGEFEVKQTDGPLLTNPSWVLAKVRVAGICGTDLRHWKKEEPDLECKIMGHEMGAEIVEVGADVPDLKPGDRVVIETVLGHETCEWCRVQKYNVCPHLYPVRMETVLRYFAGYVIAPAHKCYKLPPNVSFEEAALLDTFSVCLHAIQLSGLRINEKVVIIGAGSIGLAQLQLAKASGADVLITDITDHSLDLAAELGADVVVHAKRDDVFAQVMEFTDYRGADVVFECAGGIAMPMTLPEEVNCARISGRVVIVGGFEPEQTVKLDWMSMQKSEIKLIPSARYAYWDIYPEMQICLDLLAKGKINAKKMISHRFPIDQINEAFTVARDEEHTKALFVALTFD